MIDLSLPLNQPELMDTERLPIDELRGALTFLKITNQFFGGRSVILRHLKKFSQSWKDREMIRILDIGCGLGDIGVHISKWAETRQFNLHITGLEGVPEITELAREHSKGIPRIQIVQNKLGDHHPAEQYDYVIASLFLHHIPPSDQLDVLIKMNRLARRGIILSDLERSSMGYFAVKSLSALIGNRVVRHDGPLSVRRSFRISELNALARKAGMEYLKAAREPFFRLSLAGEKSK